ncbi:hypothetical protein DQG23_41495 [Paenibacillus contaminans]|uniref:Uncharacterized protein n=1 Tax=Paenibacillus contaminans TaxID=450362 RepID=A0A329LLX4_9BACL|nr:hypothetical protein DQG23_41495 [Paenibacillus contaminans]
MKKSYCPLLRGMAFFALRSENSANAWYGCVYGRGLAAAVSFAAENRLFLTGGVRQAVIYALFK